jgi:FMN-dependent NADH-azoreductase
MSTLLYIQASPRGARSKSIAVAGVIAEAYQELHPDDTVVTRNIFNQELPAFDGYTLQAKYAILTGRDYTPEERAAWKAVEDIISDFTAADAYLFAVPMWNFGIPYRLKQYIDILVQPGYTFSYSPAEGYSGLLTGKKAAVVYARGGAYSEPEAVPLDFQIPYLQHIFRFIGITEFTSLIVEPTLAAGPQEAARVVEQARLQAVNIAAAL